MKDLKHTIKTIRLVRVILRVLIITLVVFIIFYSFTFLYVSFKGRDMVVRKIEDIARRKVGVAFFEFTPLFNIRMQNLTIEGLGQIDEVLISPSVPYFISGNLVLNKIVVTRPVINLEHGPTKDTELPPLNNLVKKTTVPDRQTKIRGRLPFRAVFKKLIIKDGTVNYTDHTVGKDGIKISAKNIALIVNNHYSFPFSVITNFDLKATLPWQQGQAEGRLLAEGWFNFAKKDMQAAVKIERIDGIYLYPYYSQWVDLEKARIEKANLNFTSNISSLDNNLIADCHMELTDIVRTPRPPEESPEKAEKIAEAVLDLFKSLDEGRIVLDFTIRTKLSRPEFGIGKIKTAVQDKLTEGIRSRQPDMTGVVALPGRLLEGVVRSVADIGSAVIQGTVAVGNELKDAVTDPFKKPKKK